MVNIAALSPAEKEDLVTSLATLILHDAGAEISADNLNAIITASGNEVQPYWGNLISSFVEGKDLDEFLLKPGMGGGAPAAAAGGDAAPAVVEEEEEEEEEEEDVGGAGDLFGGDDEDDW